MEINAHDVRLLIKSWQRNEFTAAEALGFIRKKHGEWTSLVNSLFITYTLNLEVAFTCPWNRQIGVDALGQAEQMKMLKQFQH